ncbi:MAG: DUF86 domain-containing protein [Nanoarchaeota archaeon]|nr:DUF86 domain-containing protein [Nanoarchaeota archaeon]MBU1005176.1 DUF86 domain-containing protein [Nanoarchaeota archaeon]MBU1946806.1 DUF86 domain-containing protein [Nanoarchaeota archaeon]
MTKISDKISEIEKYIIELDEILPPNFEEYKSNKMAKAACERYFEKIVEGVTDIAFMIITKKKFELPQDDIDSFKILTEHNIIKEELYKKLKEAKGMRNFIAHQYGKINDQLVFDSIKYELIKDAKSFIKETKKY